MNKGGRPDKSTIADPRKKYDFRLNNVEHKMLIELAQRLKIDSSKCARLAIRRLNTDQSILGLDLEALQAIEDIRTVVGRASKSEAVSAAVKWCAKRYWLELLTEMVKADLTIGMN